MTKFANVFSELTTVIAARKNADPDSSYVAKLLGRGRKKIAQKIGEEAVEVAIAATENDQKEVIKESADLLFHLAVLWEKMDVSSDDVADEIAVRAGVSGLEEKKNRKS